MLEPDAVRMAVRHFRNPAVGVVNGELRFTSPDEQYRGESLYWRYEVMLKFLENRLRVVLGSSGSLCAIRKSAFRPIPPDCICDDLLVTLNAVTDGHRAVYDPEARSMETTSASIELEYLRRQRMAAGNFQALGLTLSLLDPLRGWVAFCYFSHKLLKWTTWAFMGIALAANALLVQEPLYRALFALQLAFYGLALLAALRIRLPLIGRLTSAIYYFVCMQLAMLRGLIRHLRGTQSVAWERQYR
jgi:cellulose synthase/poly-beta-1,6-N-acetylglucosamine synthase-like glycosyltransferase